MKNNINVSVIIPTYKGTSSLRRAIESVLNQTYVDIEIIVVDDNNPETEFRANTESIMIEYEENKKVKYIKHEYNKNGAAARNTGFKYSKGKYICLLDDDDIFLEDKIEKQVKYLEENQQYQGVYCWRYQNENIIGSELEGDLSKEILTLEFTPCTCSLMIRRECYEKLNGFDESYKRHQDFEFLLRFFEHYSIGVVKEPMIKICGNGVDNTLHGQQYEQLKKQFLNQFEDHINRYDLIEKGFKKNLYAKHYCNVFLNYIKRKQVLDGIRILIKYTKFCGVIFWKYIYMDIKEKMIVRKMLKYGKRYEC